MFRYSFELALGGLTRFPKSTVLVVLTAALGLAACMTTLTLLHVLSADPLPGRSQFLYRAFANTVNATPQHFANSKLIGISITPNNELEPGDANALLAAHEGVRQAAMSDITVDVAAQDGAHTLNQQQVLATSADFFPMFGVAFARGRGWAQADDEAGRPLAVIDTQTALKLFGTTDALGKSVRLGQTLFRVIGVIEPFSPQPHFFGLGAWDYSSDGGEGVFVPFTAAMAAKIVNTHPMACSADVKRGNSGTQWDPEHCAWLNYWVQLDTPQQVADYKAYLMRYATQQLALAKSKKTPQADLESVPQWLRSNNVVPDSARLNVWLALSFLVLCMFNVAGLLTARFLRRGSEIGIRRALGAPRRSVFVRCVLESSLACLAGGVLGLPLTLLGLWILRQQTGDFAGLARLDAVMFVSLFVLAIVVGALVGLLPAWRASRVEPGLQVKGA